MNLKRIAIGRPTGESGRAETASDRIEPKTTIFLFSCCIVAFLIGFYRIDFYSLWLDEYSTLMASSDWNILRAYLRTFPEQHPFYYFVIKWLSVNHTLMQIRLFSLACTMLAIFPLYFIGRRVFSSATARTACIFFILSPFVQYYSQEGRMYALFVLLALIQAGLLVKWALDGNRPAKYGFAVFSVLAMYTHFFASFLLVGEFVWLLALRIKKVQTKIRFSHAIGLYIVVGLAYTPWLLHIFSNLGGMSQSWRSLYNIAFGVPYTFFRFGAGYGIFPLNFDVKRHLAEYLPAALFWGSVFCLAYLPAAILVVKRIRKATAVQGLVFVVAFSPIILLVAASYFKNVASERYVVYSAPFFYLVVASAQESGLTGRRFLKTAALVFPILLFALGLGYHYFNPDFGKTDYKAASAHILVKDGGAFPVICHPDMVTGPMQYYLKDRMTVAAYRSWEPSASDSDVWLVERLANTPKPLSLAGNRFEKISVKVFPRENGLRVTHWRRLPLKADTTTEP